MKHVFTTLAIVGAFSIFSLQAQTAPHDAARGLSEKYRAAVVIVTTKGKVVTKLSDGKSEENEQSRRTLGVTVAKNGLLVVSNSAIDPTVGALGQKFDVKKDDKVETVEIISAKSEFEKIEISYNDKTFLSGKVVSQHPEADIAFILPENPDGKDFAMVDLSDAAPDVQIAHPVVGLSRASAIYGFTPTVVLGNITGKFKGKRTFFLTPAGTAQGMPIFTLEGKLVGLTVVRITEKGLPTQVLGTLAAGSIEVMANMANGGL